MISWQVGRLRPAIGSPHARGRQARIAAHRTAQRRPAAHQPPPDLEKQFRRSQPSQQRRHRHHLRRAVIGPLPRPPIRQRDPRRVPVARPRHELCSPQPRPRRAQPRAKPHQPPQQHRPPPRGRRTSCHLTARRHARRCCAGRGSASGCHTGRPQQSRPPPRHMSNRISHPCKLHPFPATRKQLAIFPLSR